jgi:hypothetical protein
MQHAMCHAHMHDAARRENLEQDISMWKDQKLDMSKFDLVNDKMPESATKRVFLIKDNKVGGQRWPAAPGCGPAPTVGRPCPTQCTPSLSKACAHSVRACILCDCLQLYMPLERNPLECSKPCHKHLQVRVPPHPLPYVEHAL